MIKRDENTDHIISYTNNSNIKNEGELSVIVLDGRYIKDDFSRIIDTKFKSLPEAANSDSVIATKIAIAQSNMVNGVVQLPPGYTIPPGIADNPDAVDQFKKDIAKQEFLSKLSNLIDDGGNSVAALSMQIESLRQEVENKDKIISNQLEAITNFDNILSTISNERSNAVAEAEKQQLAVNSIQQVIDEQNQKIESLMESQLQEAKRIAEDNQLTTIIALAEIISGSRQ